MVDLQPDGVTTIAEAVGVTCQNTDQQLRRLRDDGKVTSKQIGNSLTWSLADGQTVPAHVDADDTFWEAETYAGEEMSAADIDDVLYG